MSEDIAVRFERETANHVMTVLHDDGLYRHLRFKPAEASFYWFDLITVPGTLVFQGDGDSFVFRRVTDMFEFFRSPVGRINASYWAEKLTSGRESVMRYDRETFESAAMAACVAAVDDKVAPRGLAGVVRRDVLSADEADTEQGAREVLAAFEHDGFRFADSWEWNLRDYDWWFLWALHGIVWGIAQYDVHHGRTVSFAKPRPAPAKARPVVTVNLPEPAAAGGAA